TSVLVSHFLYWSFDPLVLLPFPTRRSSDLPSSARALPSRPQPSRPRPARRGRCPPENLRRAPEPRRRRARRRRRIRTSSYQHSRSEEHTSELQSLRHLVCRLLLEKKNELYS